MTALGVRAGAKSPNQPLASKPATPDSALALEVSSDHQFSMQTRASGWSEYDVLGTTYVTPYLTVLNLRGHGERGARHVTLLPDSLHAEDFRKLRVWLRWKEDRANA